MESITKHGKELIMWFLKAKDSELSFFGCVFRWMIPICALIITLAFAYNLIK